MSANNHANSQKAFKTSGGILPDTTGKIIVLAVAIAALTMIKYTRSGN